MADGDWPEFSIPDVGQTEAPSAPAETPGDPSGSSPAAPAPAPLPGTQVAGGGPSAGDDDRIPKYRFDEVSERARQSEATVQRLMAFLEQQAAQAAQAAAGQPQEPPDEDAERKQRILQQLLDLDPRIAKAIQVGERADAIFAQIERAEQSAQQEKAGWDRFAQQTLSSVHDAFASAAMGKGKLGKDLPDETRQSLTDNFVAWIMRDTTGQRVARYNEKDAALTQEFITNWSRQFVEPYRRQTAAGQVQSARRTATLPMGGGTSSPLGQPPPKPTNDEDEDAVFHRGWLHSRQQMDQSS